MLEQRKEHKLFLSPGQPGKSLNLPGSPFLLSKMKIIRRSWWESKEEMYTDRSSRRIQKGLAQEGFDCCIHAGFHSFPYFLPFCLGFLFIALSLYLIFPHMTNSIMKPEDRFAPDKEKTSPLPWLEPSQADPWPLDVGTWAGPWRTRRLTQLLLNIRERLMKPQLMSQAGCHLPVKASY